MVVHELRQRLAPDCLPVLRSDGLNQYFYALTAHFGHWVASVGRRARQWQVTAGLPCGQVKKRYRHRTAFVERVNLTIRHSIAALARQTWATLQEAPQLVLHLEWWRAYYHFVRPHESLRQELHQPIARGGQRRPSGIASGPRRWQPA